MADTNLFRPLGTRKDGTIVVEDQNPPTRRQLAPGDFVCGVSRLLTLEGGKRYEALVIEGKDSEKLSSPYNLNELPRGVSRETLLRAIQDAARDPETSLRYPEFGRENEESCAPVGRRNLLIPNIS